MGKNLFRGGASQSDVNSYTDIGVFFLKNLHLLWKVIIFLL